MPTNLRLLISMPALALAIAFGCEQSAKKSSDEEATTSIPESIATSPDTSIDTSTTTDCYVNSSTDTSTATSTQISSTNCGTTGTGFDDFYEPKAKADCANLGKPYIYIQGHEGCLQNVTLVAYGSSWCTDKTTILNKFVAEGYQLDNPTHPETSLNYNWNKATADGSVVSQCGILSAQVGSYPANTPFVSFVNKTTTTDASGGSVPKVIQWGLPDILPH